MTHKEAHPFSSTSAIANLVSRVVLLLLGTPPTLVRVAAAVDAADSRITRKGGQANGRA